MTVLCWNTTWISLYSSDYNFFNFLLHLRVFLTQGIIIIIIIIIIIMVWKVTVATTLADSYVSASAALAGAAAETAATRKSVKYADLPALYLFEPIAFETLGPMNLSALNLLNDLGRKISSVRYLVTTERDISSFSVCRSFCSVIIYIYIYTFIHHEGRTNKRMRQTGRQINTTSKHTS